MKHFASTAIFIVLLQACRPEPVDYRDRKGPKIVSVEPADNATDVAVSAEIVVQYSEAILPQSVGPTTIVVKAGSGEPVVGFIVLNHDRVRFRPTTPLTFEQTYTVQAGAGVKDLFGNRAETKTWRFTTGRDTVAPRAPYNLSYPPITNQLEVNITGAKEADAELYVNGQPTGIREGVAYFTHRVALANEGQNVLTLEVVDAAGNRSPGVKVVIVRDRQPPVGVATCGTGTTPRTRGLVWHVGERSGCWNPPETFGWNNELLTLGAEWIPEPQAVAFLRLGAAEFLSQASRFQTDFAALEGVATLQAGAIDEAGNETISFERTIVVRRTPPVLYIQSGMPAATTTVATGNVVVVKEAGVPLGAWLDGSPWWPTGSCDTSATQCTFTFGPLAHGRHRFAMAATDAAGNVTRLERIVAVDRGLEAPRLVPPPLANTGPRPLFHAFFTEPVTVSVLDIQPAGLRLNPIQGRSPMHWMFGPVETDLTGAQTASATAVDSAGNARVLQFTFTATPTATTPAPLSPNLTMLSGRAGKFEVGALPASNVMSALWYREADAANPYRLATTYATVTTASADSLSEIDAWVDSYSVDGTWSTVDLPRQGWFALNSPVTSFMGVAEFASLLPFPDGGVTGFTAVLSGSLSGQWVQAHGSGTAMSTPLDDVCSNAGAEVDVYARYPLVTLTPEWGLLGKPCPGVAARVSRIRLAVTAPVQAPVFANRSTIAESSAPNSDFGVAVTVGMLLGNGRQLIIGDPVAERVYVYASTEATAVAAVLRPSPQRYNTRFGAGVALAVNHVVGENTLAILASREPAIYFYDAAGLSSLMPVYRTRYGWTLDAECRSPVTIYDRVELLNARDLDGDGHEDFAVASFTCAHKLNLRIFFGGFGVAGTPVLLTQAFGQLSGFRPQLRALGDVNGDGYADLGFIDRSNSGIVRIFYGSATGELKATTLFPFSTSAMDGWLLLGAVDREGDGFAELVLARVSNGWTSLWQWP